MLLKNSFIDYCRNLAEVGQIDLNGDDMKYYSGLPLCILDAVFSIRARYEAVVNVINRFCEHYELPRQIGDGSTQPPIEAQLTVSHVSELLKTTTPSEFAEIIGNRSKINGRLKSEIFFEDITLFLENKIDNYTDFHNRFDDDNFHNRLLQIYGRGNAMTDYLYMLAGNENDVKVDVHIGHFARLATSNDDLTDNEIKDMFRAAAEYFGTHGYPGMTPRRLDHIIWGYMRNIALPEA